MNILSRLLMCSLLLAEFCLNLSAPSRLISDHQMVNGRTEGRGTRSGSVSLEVGRKREGETLSPISQMVESS